MEDAILIKSQEEVSFDEKKEIDKKIDALLQTVSRQTNEINQLVFESVTALTASEAKRRELANQGFLKRFLGGVTGKNQKLQSQADTFLVKAQYASQRILEKLAEQNLMTFEMVVTLNNKLNATVLDIDNSINQVYEELGDIYDVLGNFFEKTRNRIIQLENRVERLEQNVRLLQWSNTIEYQLFDCKEYRRLNDVEKCICLIHDFYTFTDGKWTFPDLILLKATMDKIGLEPSEKVNYIDFIAEVGTSVELRGYIQALIPSVEKLYPEQTPLLAAIKKQDMLEYEEAYFVEGLCGIIDDSGKRLERKDIIKKIIASYIRNQGYVDLYKEVSFYDLALEFLFDISYLKNEKANECLKQEMRMAEGLFLGYSMKMAYPILQKLVEKGYTRANYFLAKFIEDDYQNIAAEGYTIEDLIYEGWIKGEPLCGSFYLRNHPNMDLELKAEMYQQCKDKLRKLVKEGDVFAAYELGLCYINQTDEEKDYVQAFQCFQKAAESGYWKADNSIGISYRDGRGVEMDAQKAIDWFRRGAEKGFSLAQYNLAVMYQYAVGVRRDMEQAMSWYKKAAGQGQRKAVKALMELSK